MSDIYYTSTRGGDEKISSSQAILKGIADNGGLYVPSVFPGLSRNLGDFLNMDYNKLAYSILRAYFSDMDGEDLKQCIDSAYDGKFDTPDIVPVKKVGSDYFMELFHGPTLAFKDMALSILPHLMKKALIKTGIDKEIVILTATSGDTGKAALEGFNDIDGIKVIVFYPEDGVSEIQKLQMTTHNGRNTFVLGITDNFDAAQSGVKDIFNDNKTAKYLNDRGFMLSSANSINIGRLFPQVVYYFHAYFCLCRMGEINTGDMINAAVPTGNFGNILAGYIAKLMGLPIKKLICASNENKVLYDFFKTGQYDTRREFFITISPSMDILISSNLERLLYIINGGDGQNTGSLMKDLREKGVYSITSQMRERLKCFYGGYADDAATRKAIKEVFLSHGYIMDTHTAVAYSVYKKYVEDSGDAAKTVILSTASPFKFPSEVLGSIDERYANMDNCQLIEEMSRLCGINIPKSLRDIKSKPVVHNRVCSPDGMKSVVYNILGL